MAEVAEAVVQASVKPVSVKIRIGISASDINCARTVSVLQDCGVTAITVHGRTRTQMYAGKANLDEIAKAVSTAEIPIIGNGDVSDAASYLRMKETGCAGVMIGRAAMGTMTTTLLLAYSGSFVALLMVFMAQGTPLINVFNYKYVASEIIHTIVGSFGLVAAAPLTAIASGLLLAHPEQTAQAEAAPIKE